MVYQHVVFYGVALVENVFVDRAGRSDTAFAGDLLEQLIQLLLLQRGGVGNGEGEAQSEQQLLMKLREAKQSPAGRDSVGPTSMLVMADEECHHETVVMVLDAGSAVGMENVRLTTGDGR